MRVSTAFNRLLQIPGAWVTDVVIGDGDVEVTLRPRARLLTCRAGCCARGGLMTGGGAAGRHLSTWVDAGGGWSTRSAGWELPDCGSAHRGAALGTPGGTAYPRFRADMAPWLAQRTDRTLGGHPDAPRLGETVTAIINRGAAELLKTRRPQALDRIGVDEVVLSAGPAHAI